MSTEIDKGERRSPPTHITLTKESYSRITPLPRRTGYRLVIFSRGNLPYTQSFLAEVDQDACPLGFSHIPPNYSRLSRERTGD